MPWKDNLQTVDVIADITSLDTVDVVTLVSESRQYLYSVESAVWKRARVDESTLSTVTITHSHHEIHEGISFFAHTNATLNTGNTISIAITTPNTDVEQHLIVDIRADNNGTFQYISGVTSYTGGNAYTPVNRNPRIGTASGTTVKQGYTGNNPLVLTGGTTKYTEIISSNKGVQWDRNSGEEVVLPKNSTEVFRVTAAANGMTISILCNWYEHTPEV